MKYLLRHGSGMYSASTPLFGTGWTSESTHRTAVCSAAGLRSVVVAVIVVSLDRKFFAAVRLSTLEAGSYVNAVQLCGITPAQLVALFGRERAGHFKVVQLPVRVAGPVHHHVVLAGEAEPFAGELGVAGAVHGALDEVGVAGQVVAGDVGCPWRLFKVG